MLFSKLMENIWGFFE